MKNEKKLKGIFDAIFTVGLVGTLIVFSATSYIENKDRNEKLLDEVSKINTAIIERLHEVDKYNKCNK